MSPTSSESKLYVQATIGGNWEEVVKIYREEKDKAWLAEITSAKDTTLHSAIIEGKEDIVEKLVSIIKVNSNMHEAESAKKALRAKNESGDTPLHHAAAKGSKKMCKYIIEAGQNLGFENKDLLSITNNWGQNPILVATLNNRKHVFFYLVFKAAAGVELEPLFRCSGNGDTVLHVAIKRGHYDLALHMIKLFPDKLLDKCNSKGMTPLHVLASKPYAFRSGYHITTWWKWIIYHSIYVEPLKYHPSGTTTDPRSSNPDRYLIFSGRKQTDVDPENPNSSDIRGNIPRNYDTCFQLLATVFLNFVNFLGFVKLVKDIIRAKQRHKWSIQLLDEILKNPAKAYMTKNDGGQPSDLGEEFGHDTLPMSLGYLKKNEEHKENQKETRKADDEGEQERIDTPLLVATQKGAVEVVRKILLELPLAIRDTSYMKNKNILLIAAENRRPMILYLVKRYLTRKLKKQELWDNLIQAMDNDENTMLHLAAKYEESMFHPWQVRGTAMRMQWEIKWYEYVSSLLPPHFVDLANQKGETPWQIFMAKHEMLIKNSGDWLNNTSGSCSVVAALVAGVTFATASQVPGGTDRDGKPNLEGDPAFELCTVTALLGLCFSVTSLIMYLCILTHRKQALDFKVNLPFKLLLGLCSLFLSIACMLISFGAAYFFLLNNKFHNGLYPLYAVICLPLSIYAIEQFPLYIDLLKATVALVPQFFTFRGLFSAAPE